MQLTEVLFSFFKSPLLNCILIILVAIAAFDCVRKYREYKASSYYKITRSSIFSVRHNKGKYGEYLTYKYLKEYEAKGAKFLFNTYIPKDDGETTEIDVLMICSKGIFVFESKNYSGWIFGSEYQKNWYQTLPTGRGRSHKEHFYNPIMQNYSHIKHLKAMIGDSFPMRSVIVFSDRCTLKSIQLKSEDIVVVNRYDVLKAVNSICAQVAENAMTDNDIKYVYDRLYPYTQVDSSIKEKHIDNIHKNLGLQFCQESTDSEIESNEQLITSKTDDIVPAEASVQILKDDNNQHKSIVNQDTESHDEVEVLKCPRCGSDLVLRTATRGANVGNQFYGCSGYPKCRYIQSVTDKS